MLSRLQIAGFELELLEIPASASRGVAMLLLHEGLGCVELWRDFPQALAGACELPAFAYSRAGYGGSSPVELPRPLSYMHDEARQVLPLLLERLAQREFVLVGHSDGASIALIHAAMNRGVHPVRGLVLLAPHVFCEERSVQAIAQARDAYLQGELRQRLERYHGANVDCAFWGWNGAWLDPEFRHWDLRELLSAVTCPTLVIQSQDDPYGTLAQVDAIAAGISGTCERLILEGNDHAPQRTHRERTIAAIASFVQRLLSPPNPDPA
ncbi:MAG: alpha/beta hydrolase [Polyangiaceae bacterium]